MKNNVRIGVIGGLLAAALILSGCAIGVGNRPAPDAAYPTVGQELTDLKKARDSGAISEEEYQAQKQKLLAR
jgi:hypothetical protein